MKPYRSSRFGKAGQGFALVVKLVMMGSERRNLSTEERVIDNPGDEANGMSRMPVGYFGQEKKINSCFDRYIPYIPESRDFLLFLSDATTGTRPYSPSESVHSNERAIRNKRPGYRVADGYSWDLAIREAGVDWRKWKNGVHSLRN